MPTEDGKLNMNDLTMIMDAKNIANKANEKVDNLVAKLNVDNKPTNGELALMIGSLTEKVVIGFAAIHEIQEKFNTEVKEVKDTTRELLLWKVGFVAKFSVYSAIALIVGSLLSQLLLNFLGKYI